MKLTVAIKQYGVLKQQLRKSYIHQQNWDRIWVGTLIRMPQRFIVKVTVAIFNEKKILS